MPESNTVTDYATRAAALAELVDLEARWENLRVATAGTPSSATLQELHGKQRAYEMFHAKLVAFNKRHVPAHVPEMLLNTPLRLGAWCKKMRDLFVQVEHDPRAQIPLHLVEKAHRCADRVADRQGKERGLRRSAPGDIRSVINQMDDLARWCDTLTHPASVA